MLYCVCHAANCFFHLTVYLWNSLRSNSFLVVAIWLCTEWRMYLFFFFFFRFSSVILGHYRPKFCCQHPHLCLLAHKCVFLRNIPIARSYGVKLSVLINNANLLFRVAMLIDSPTTGSIWECQFSFVLTNTWRHQTFLFLPIHGQKMVSCLTFFLDFSWEGAPSCV